MQVHIADSRGNNNYAVMHSKCQTKERHRKKLTATNQNHGWKITSTKRQIEEETPTEAYDVGCLKPMDGFRGLFSHRSKSTNSRDYLENN